MVKDSIHQIDERIKILREKLESASASSDDKSRIEADYAQQDIERANENRNKLLYKYDLLMQQLAKEESK